MTSSALIASDLKINLLGGGLVILGLVLLVATIAFWRSAVEDPEVLAPLEVMAGRRYGRASAARRSTMLAKVRPGGDETFLTETDRTVAPAANSPEGGDLDAPDPRAVRRLRGREPRRQRHQENQSTGGSIDPLLGPTTRRE